MKVEEKGVMFAGYKRGGKGFLVEHFDVERANKLLSSEDKRTPAKKFKIECQLLAEQDKELRLIQGNRHEVVSRGQLDGFGTKINAEGSVSTITY